MPVFVMKFAINVYKGFARVANRVYNSYQGRSGKISGYQILRDSYIAKVC